MKHARPALLAAALLSMAGAASGQSGSPPMPALMAPPPPPSVPALPSAAEIAARLPKARALVALVNPNDLSLQANMRGWEAAFTQSFAVNPAASSIEQRYPGATRAAMEAVRPLALENCQRYVTEMNEYKAARFAERLSPAELDTAIAFFGSPAGRRFIQRMFGHADPAALGRDTASRAAETGQPQVSADRVRQMEMEAARRTVGEMSVDEQSALVRFGRTSAAIKIKLATVEVDRYALDKANRPDPAWKSRQSELVNKTILDFIAAHKTL